MITFRFRATDFGNALLTRLMIDHGVGCRVEDTLYVKKLDDEFFEF